MMTRRHALKLTGLAVAATAASAAGQVNVQPNRALAGSAAPTAAGPYTLPPLPYAADALEPYIDAQTMEIHHDRHHAGYVANLNKAVSGHPELAKKSVEQLLIDIEKVPEEIRTAVRNHGGGHANHSLFWQTLAPNKTGNVPLPGKEGLKVFLDQLGGFQKFRDQFTQAASGVFGSGWAWLTLDSNRKMRVESTPNQDNPLMFGRTPLLGLDVWEHAYYLKYQNKRADYIAAFWQVVNWNAVMDRYYKLVGRR